MNYITTKQLSELTGWTVASIHCMTARKQVPFYKFGKKNLFLISEIEELIAKKRINPSNEV